MATVVYTVSNATGGLENSTRIAEQILRLYGVNVQSGNLALNATVDGVTAPTIAIT